VTDIDKTAAETVAMTVAEHIAKSARYLAHGDFARSQIHASLAAAKAAVSQRR
jgi:hypothetical protein